MRFLLAYLKQRRGVIAAFTAFSLIFALGFFLYQLPLAAVLYPALLCALLALALAIFDLLRVRARHNLLVQLQNLPENLVESLPAPRTLDEADYAQIIRHLQASKAQISAAAQAAQTQQAQYTATWAHQIKTPIASMRLQLQNEDTPLSRTLLLELNRVEQYVEMLLACQRLGSSCSDYLFRECDLDAIIRTALRRFSGEFIARRLHLNYEGVHLRVVTDEKWLTFVLEQLLSNALKYTRSGGISIYMQGKATLCIRDTGIGIAPEDLPRIFENGYTGLNGRIDQRASGLGLHLCMHICHNLGHEISAESTPGAGTVMRINLCQRKTFAD